jgi:hypothetical protein
MIDDVGYVVYVSYDLFTFMTTDWDSLGFIPLFFICCCSRCILAFLASHCCSYVVIVDDVLIRPSRLAQHNNQSSSSNSSALVHDLNPVAPPLASPLARSTSQVVSPFLFFLQLHTLFANAKRIKGLAGRAPPSPTPTFHIRLRYTKPTASTAPTSLPYNMKVAIFTAIALFGAAVAAPVAAPVRNDPAIVQRCVPFCKLPQRAHSLLPSFLSFLFCPCFLPFVLSFFVQ